MKHFLAVLTGVLTTGLVLLTVSCKKERSALYTLKPVAQSYELWTGVAVSKEGRIFVNYPRWSGAETTSVAEIVNANFLRPYPNETWNMWDTSLSPRDHFICVQSVYVDDDNYLWILDAASPMLGGVVRGGAKLVKVDLRSDEIVQEITFDEYVAPERSYFNDVRVDTEGKFAYITDSGKGAIIVVDLTTGRARRTLYAHHSTKAEDTTFVVEGITIGAKINSDGLALDPSGEYLYYQALTGRSLYRIRTIWLQDSSLSEQELGDRVEFVAKTGVADGIEFGKDGNLYLTSLEYNALRRFTPEGKVETVVQDPGLKWPDSIFIVPGGDIYVTTSQLHLGPKRVDPYRIYRVAAD